MGDNSDPPCTDCKPLRSYAPLAFCPPAQLKMIKKMWLNITQSQVTTQNYSLITAEHKVVIYLQLKT